MRIVSTIALTEQQRVAIAHAAPQAQLDDRRCRTSAEAAALIAEGCEILFSPPLLVPDGVVRLSPRLKWIQLTSAGADRMRALGVLDSAVQVTTVSGIHCTPMAEYVIASMLAYAHRLHVSIRAQTRKQWLGPGWLATAPFLGAVDELRGKALGVLGYGSVGREVARLARVFGMRILALKRNPEVRRDSGWCPPGLGDPEGVIPERFFGPEERRAMLAECDYVVVVLPLTEATEKFLGRRELAALRPHAYLVNVGRGGLIDQPALVEALSSGRLGGAGLDVFEPEPLPPESPLWEMENVIVTPHMAGVFRGYFDAAASLFADNLRRFFAAQPLVNPVDPAAGY